MPSQTPSLPHDPDAEQIILANCFLSASREPLGDLDPQDFYSAQNAKIAQAIVALAESNQPINFLEVVRQLDAHNNGVPASYVSGLTDGIPEVKDIEPYRGRIRTSRQERGVMWEANALARAAESGESAVQIVERAEQLAAHAKPAERKPAGYAAKYPKIPDDAWIPAAEIYRKALAHSTEGSDSWHFICFYTVVGALLGRTVFTRMGRRIYPNFFTVLVGLVGGDGKDTCIDYSLDFANSIDEHLYIPTTIDSKEGFIVNWSRFQTRLTESKVIESPRAILRLAELRALLDKAEQKGTRNMIPMLNALYDSPPKLSNESVSNPGCVDDPHGCLLIGTASRWMKNMSEVDLVSGFGRRLIFVPGDPKPPLAEPDPPDDEYLVPLSLQTKEVVEFWKSKPFKRLDLSPAARKLWGGWYKTYKTRIVTDDLIGAMSIGDRTTCRKVALLNAALDRADKIEDFHLAPAIAFTEFLFESRWPVFSEHGASPYREIETKMVNIVSNSPQRRITSRNLQQRIRVDAETFHRRLKYLCAPDGLLKLEREGRRWIVSIQD